MADEVTQGESSATRKNRATGAISISFGMASSPVRASGYSLDTEYGEKLSFMC